jgi:hypothetical protein
MEPVMGIGTEYLITITPNALPRSLHQPFPFGVKLASMHPGSSTFLRPHRLKANHGARNDRFCVNLRHFCQLQPVIIPSI